MKIQLSRKLKQMASALLVTMVLGGILCLSVMYYLSLIQQQNTLSVRSQAWNLAIAVTEAGIEEGLQALNSSAVPSSADGWYPDGTGTYWRTNQHESLGGNNYTVSLYPDIASLPRTPIITARSYISLPALAAAPSWTMFAVVGSAYPSAKPAATIVSRAVRVTCGKTSSSLFTAALVSKHAIDLNGNGVSSDSFDSSDPNKSTNGKYDPNKYKGDFGQVASNDGIVVGIGNANIYGTMHTGPNGSYSLGPNGGVGTHVWQAANVGKIQPDWFLQDANFTFPDTKLPDTSKGGYVQPGSLDVWFPTNTVIPTFHTAPAGNPPNPIPDGMVTNLKKNGTVINYTWTTLVTNALYVTNRLYDNVLDAGGKYVSSGLTGTTIVRGPNVELVLPNGLTGAEQFFFDYADNAHPGLTVYAGGTEASISGNQYVNPSGFAGSLLIYCAPTVTSFTLNGNGQFTGVLVAPNADLAMNGGGNSDQDFCGSLMVNNVRLNGHFKFHWDEALGRMNSDNDARFLVKSWNEIP
jgi:hypothetical protein